MYPIVLRHSRKETVRISLPSASTVPDAGSIRRSNRSATVDLPTPDGPTIATICPCLTEKLISLKTSPLLGYENETFRNSIPSAIVAELIPPVDSAFVSASS